MSVLPTDVVEITMVREDGEVLRWVGQEAAMVTRMVALVFQAAGDATLQAPDPARSYPWRKVVELVGRYRENHRKEGWLYCERPSCNLDVEDLLPPQMTEIVAGERLKDDEFGNVVRAEGPLCRVRCIVEVQPEG